jgi:predicted O-methyltransferase YrrM
VKEKESARWARGRVASHFIRNLANPEREKNPISVMYRSLKNEAAAIPRKDLSEIFPGIEQSEIRVKYSPKHGGGKLSDLISLAQIVKFQNSERMFEFGTFRGFTTYHLATNTPASSRIFTIDLPASDLANAQLELTNLDLIQKPISGEWFKNTECESKITQLFGDSAKFDFSPYAGSMDFIFIDGAHSYEYVISDSENARKMLRPDGIITWHDYPAYPGVWAALEELSKKWPGTFSWINGTEVALWRPS